MIEPQIPDDPIDCLTEMDRELLQAWKWDPTYRPPTVASINPYGGLVFHVSARRHLLYLVFCVGMSFVVSTPIWLFWCALALTLQVANGFRYVKPSEPIVLKPVEVGAKEQRRAHAPHGGHSSSTTPITQYPQAPSGPAPGARVPSFGPKTQQAIQAFAARHPEVWIPDEVMFGSSLEQAKIDTELSLRVHRFLLASHPACWVEPDIEPPPPDVVIER